MSEKNKNAALAPEHSQDQEMKRTNQFKETMKRLFKNKGAIVGLVVIVLLFLMLLFADQIAPYDYAKQDFSVVYQKPSAQHWMGTDELGRDVLSRIIVGSRLSMKMGLLSVAIAATIGIIFGSIAGYYGGAVDNILMRFLDIYQSIPGTIFCVALAAVLGPGLNNAIIAVGITSMSGYARLIRASIMQVRGMEYIEAARSINAKDARILLKHIIPNAISPLIVSITMSIGGCILLAASLSFIGLGAQPPLPEWGAMLSAGRSKMRDCGYLVIFPGLAIMVSVLAFNLLGDGLRDALDPRLRN